MQKLVLFNLGQGGKEKLKRIKWPRCCECVSKELGGLRVEEFLVMKGEVGREGRKCKLGGGLNGVIESYNQLSKYLKEYCSTVICILLILRICNAVIFMILVIL